MARIGMLIKNKSFMGCITVVAAVILVGILMPYFTPDPGAMIYESAVPPSGANYLGTNVFGQDMFARLVAGIQNSLMVGFIAGLLGIAIAILVGGFGGYVGGLTDEFLNVISNIFLLVPLVPVLIILNSLFTSRSLVLVSVIIGVIVWSGPARQIRSQVLSLKERSFVDLARVSGKSDLNILTKEIFPNMLSFVVISFFNMIGIAIITEAGISLIGLGPTTVATLGGILHNAIMNAALIYGRWWWIIPPGIVLLIFTGTLIKMVTVIDEVLNPRLRTYE